ncbi:LLM class flavin-dependent oxidoreductase [Devosia sp. MC521]|uniref:LLM class flavin-dependent oxidoreductase n=1 Tax=Devosia sp. MC521 TaxID=2759954 RepID=UPI0032BF5470
MCRDFPCFIGWRDRDASGRVTVVEAKLSTRPQRPIPLFGGAVTPATAAFCGRWADGLLTTGCNIDDLRQVVGAFRDNGGEDKPVDIQHALSWAADEEIAIREALDQWRAPSVGGDAAWDLRQPQDFDAVARTMTLDHLRKCIAISSDVGKHRAHIEAMAELKPAAIHLHCVGRNQRAFINMAAKHLVTTA